MSRALTLSAAAIAVVLSSGAPAAQAPAGRAVEIAAPDGLILRGTLFSAPAAGPAVLLLHQCDNQRHVWDPLGPKLAAAGITALAIDFRGYGESGGTPHDKLPNAELGQQMTAVWPGDVDAALAFLAKQPGVTPDRLGAAGGSCAVNQAVRLAQRRDTVKALALLAGPADRDGRLFLQKPGAPPVHTSAAADDEYGDFVQIMGWLHGVSSRSESRFAQYRDGGHAAVVFKTHPDLADAIAQWFGAVLKGTPAALPANIGAPIDRATIDRLQAIDRPGGAAAAIARLSSGGRTADALNVPEYLVNLLGYEHIQIKDHATAIDILRLNTLLYPASANAADSLGDAYLAAGDAASALAAARKTLELLEKDPRVTPQLKTQLRTIAEDKIKRLSK